MVLDTEILTLFAKYASTSIYFVICMILKFLHTFYKSGDNADWAIIYRGMSVPR